MVSEPLKSRLHISALALSALLVSALAYGDPHLFGALAAGTVLAFSFAMEANVWSLIKRFAVPGYAFVSTVFGYLSVTALAVLIAYVEVVSGHLGNPGVLWRIALMQRSLMAMTVALLPLIGQRVTLSGARASALVVAALAATASVWPLGAPQDTTASEVSLLSLSRTAAQAIAAAHVAIYLLGLVLLAMSRERAAPRLRLGMSIIDICGLVSSTLLAFKGQSAVVDSVGDYLYASMYPLAYAIILQQIRTVEYVALKRSHERYEAQYRFLMRKFLSVREDERKRIALQLHDDVGQMMSLVIGTLTPRPGDTKEPIDLVSKARVLAAEALEAVRRITRDLRPSVLDDIGLVAALQSYIATYSEAHTISVDLRVVGTADRRVAGDVESAVYWSIVEALTNVARHSGASRVSVVLDIQGTILTAIVEDNGRGFSTDQSSQGMGLRIMAERARLVNGECVVESLPGAGTTVAIRVPIGDSTDGGDG